MFSLVLFLVLYHQQGFLFYSTMMSRNEIKLRVKGGKVAQEEKVGMKSK